jgi:hypothetical protein
MILIDFSQVMLSNLHMQLGGHTNVEVKEDLFRHMVLNSLRSYKQRFGADYGQLIICCDNKHYWRKDLFPYYKAHRKKIQEKSELNWTEIFEHLNKIKSEIREFFPYPVIEVEKAEADDIIATMCLTKQEKILILSADKDFIQLHYLPHVKQYNPIKKQWVTHDDPHAYLEQHIIKGDSGDGIPNILSPDNCMVIGERQKPMTAKRMALYMGTHPLDYDDVAARNYHRNAQLINLTLIPLDIRLKIEEEYIRESGKKRDKLMNYFIKNRLKNLIENLSEF